MRCKVVAGVGGPLWLQAVLCISCSQANAKAIEKMHAPWLQEPSEARKNRNLYIRASRFENFLQPELWTL